MLHVQCGIFYTIVTSSSCFFPWVNPLFWNSFRVTGKLWGWYREPPAHAPSSPSVDTVLHRGTLVNTEELPAILSSKLNFRMCSDVTDLPLMSLCYSSILSRTMLRKKVLKAVLHSSECWERWSLVLFGQIVGASHSAWLLVLIISHVEGGRRGPSGCS